MNGSGVVVGDYTDVNNVLHGFVRAADGSITSFDPPGSTLTEPGGINDNGTVAGTYSGAIGAYVGFVRTASGEYTTFSVLPTGFGTVAVGINDAGTFTGYFGIGTSVLSTK
jgi:predicted membrane protein